MYKIMNKSKNHKLRLNCVSRCFLITMWLILPSLGIPQEMIPDEVFDLFDNSCAFSGCHSGPNAPKKLDLTEEFILPSLVNKPSSEKPEILRVKPGDPANSYLIMKIKGSPGIEGDRMPKKGKPLSKEEVAVLESWIKSLPVELKVVAPKREFAQAFPGWTLSNLPTAETLDTGVFLYRIAHRWKGAVGEGFDQLFGLDFGAHMFTQLAFSITNDLMLTVARSGENATFEFGGKWRFLRQKTDGSVPVSAAITAGLDWETIKEIVDPDNPTSVKGLSRTDGERFHWFIQLALTKKIHERFSVLLVPGILLNGNVNVSDEDPIFTLGFAGKIMIFKDFSLFVEGVPILSGEENAATVGGPRIDNGKQVINDTFTIGLERKIGGHVFHVYITNSLGLATSQYMSGGNFDFDIFDGDFRLGFNIYRILRLPF